MTYTIRILGRAEAFISSLDVKFRAKVFRSIELLREFGPFLREPYSKRVRSTHKLYELRVILGTDICRLFYFHYKKGLYVITSGYMKKERKLNPIEIEKAVRIMNRYEEKQDERSC